jgi:transcriptional regulator with XRE-family HTH domain
MPQHPGPGPANERVGENLKIQRERKNMTQQALADVLGPPATQQIVAKHELGKTGMRVEQLLAYARALRVRPETLLRGAIDLVSTDGAR